MTIRWGRACAAGLMAVTALMAGCSGSDGEDPDGSSKSEVPDALDPVWTADHTGSPAGRMVRSGDTVLHLSREGVISIDPESGETRWARTIQQGCTTGEPNAAGDVPFTFGPQCRGVGVVDGDTGKVRWRKQIAPVSKGYDAGDVVASIGDRTVTVVQFCGQVTRLSLKDGHRLGVLAPHDRLCGNEADSDGQVIALWHDAETADTPDDHGTGLVAPHEGEAAFELYDADSGKLMWRRNRSRESSGLREGAVVNSSPVMLTLREDGHTTMRRYSGKRDRRGKVFGRQMDAHRGHFSPIVVQDGVMLGIYSHSDPGSLGEPGQRIFAYDVGTGRELWSRATRGRDSQTETWISQLVGADQDGVVVASRSAYRDDPTMWLTRWDLRTGKDLGFVGRVEGPTGGLPVMHVSDGLLLAQQGTDLSAYQLQEPDPEVTIPSEERDWADDDLRPDPMTDPCTAVSAATLRTLGLRSSTRLPTPEDCTWEEFDQPRRSERALRVRVHVAEPTTKLNLEGDVVSATAVENAEQTAAEWRKEFQPDLTPSLTQAAMRRPQRLDGLGDEAYLTTGARLVGSLGVVNGTYLMVRIGNAVVEVQTAGGYEGHSPGSAPASPTRAEAGTFAAAREVFASLGLDLDEPSKPDPGLHRRASNVCGELEAEAHALGMPDGGSLAPKGSDRRVAECFWEQQDTQNDLSIHVYAASGTLLGGKPAPVVAHELFRASRSSSDRALRGLGDVAVINRRDATEADDGYSITQRDVLVRVDNLVVDLSYAVDGEGLGAGAEEDAIRLTRKVIDIVRSNK